jgi:hypothetical protein
MIRLSQEAQEQIRSMEDRIGQQAAEVVKLSVYRGDASDAIRRLELMRTALAEMRVQLQALCSTEDTKLSNTDVAMKALGKD